MRRALVVLAPAFFSLACSQKPALPPSRPEQVAQGKTPPVVVAIVIDQFAAWVAEERFPLLPSNGGFAKLTKEGTYLQRVQYDHAVTDTAPGHAALFTGQIPRVNGVVGNEVLDDQGERTSVLRDPSARLVGPEGVRSTPSASIACLRVDTLADRLRSAYPKSEIVALSLKDRGAIFGGGRNSNATLWYDAPSDSLVTSTAFAQALPPWTSSFLHPAAMVNSDWNPLDLGFIQRHAAGPDEQAGEGDLGGLGRKFPHTLPVSEKRGFAFRATPFADEYLFRLAISAIDARTDKNQPYFLTLSLSANDYIGHTFGPDSWEAWDEIRRLDTLLGEFISVLDKKLGSYSLVLSADHGVARMPEARKSISPMGACARGKAPWNLRCETSSRLVPQDLARNLQQMMQQNLGPGKWIQGVSDPYIYLGARALENRESRHKAVEEVRRLLSAESGIAKIYDVGEFPVLCPTEKQSPIDHLVCNSTKAGATEVLYVLTAPGSFFVANVVTGEGTSHGTPYDYDRTVPILARAPGRIPANKRYSEALSFASYARTISSLLGIDSSSYSGTDLTAGK